MKKTNVVLVSFESVADGTAPSLHVGGTKRRLGAAGCQTIGECYTPHAGRWLRWLLVYAKLIRLMPSADALVIRYHPVSVPALVLSVLLGKRSILLVQGVPADAESTYPWLRRFGYVNNLLAKIAIRLSDRVFAPTPGIVRWVINETGKTAELLPNGTASLEVADRTGVDHLLPAQYLCFSGLLATWQGVGVMIDAVRSPLWPEGIPLVVVGDGVCEDQVRNAADSGIIPVGRLSAAESRRVQQGAIATLSVKTPGPSTRHGVSPFKVLESASVGTPIIVSRIEGQWELVDEMRAGIVVEPNDASAVARAAALLSSDPELRSRLGSNALQLARSSRWESYSETLAEALVSRRQ